MFLLNIPCSLEIDYSPDFFHEVLVSVSAKTVFPTTTSNVTVTAVTFSRSSHRWDVNHGAAPWHNKLLLILNDMHTPIEYQMVCSARLNGRIVKKRRVVQVDRETSTFVDFLESPKLKPCKVSVSGFGKRKLLSVMVGE